VLGESSEGVRTSRVETATAVGREEACKRSRCAWTRPGSFQAPRRWGSYGVRGRSGSPRTPPHYADAPALGDMTPYEALLAGEREAVLEPAMGRPGADGTTRLVSCEDGARMRAAPANFKRELQPSQCGRRDSNPHGLRPRGPKPRASTHIPPRPQRAAF
jgi:hypothetical protein